MTETERAVAAALELAAEAGLAVEEARILRDDSNVTIQLVPLPVVARVSATLARFRGRRAVEDELRFAAHGLAAGAPIVPPAIELPAGPYERDGFLVSFWRYVEHERPDEPDGAAVGRSLRALHDALAGSELPLPRFDRLDEAAGVLAGLEPAELATSEELDTLARALPLARARLAGLELHEQPIHGDAHFGNVLWTATGPVWSDLENVCVGPVEYDLACLAWRGRIGDGPSAAGALAAYGDYDADALEAVEPALAVFVTAWTIVIARRTPTPAARAFLQRRLGYMRDLVS